ncbi:hypothetical protein CWE22_10205 [Pseudidiomarina aestuarii]|uniref:Uncharacterized protein n=2 Tax=Pseudidiomarina aestuarii TaxID=624146 RepID=A0A7Z6ZRV9_9GAMM|nr:hypothetical protein CWE22_10205 [Pseudidiomarina aestuarii]
MNINMTYIGLGMILFMIVTIIVTYLLGKRKTQNAGWAAFVGFLTAFVPPIALLYMIVLVMKKDVDAESKV